jgi:hypothetical protein
MKNRNLLYLAMGLVWIVALAGIAVAQNGPAHPVEGTYAVTAIGSEIGTVTFTMTLKRNGDKWGAEVTDSPLPMTIKNVVVGADDKVTITAATGDAEVMIVGKFEAGKIVGDWSAGEAKGTWSALRKDTGAAPTRAATTGSTSTLEGTYDAEVTAEGQGSLPFTLIIKRSGDKLVTEVPNAGDLNITGIEVNGDAVTLNATFQGNPFALPGKVSGGNLGGTWEAGGFKGTWSAKPKRTASAPATATAPASTASSAALEGTYDAQVTAEGQGSLPFTLIIKRSGDKLVTEVQNGGDLNVTGIEVSGETVTLNATFQGNPFALPGKVSAGTMGGNWEAGGFKGTWTAKKK